MNRDTITNNTPIQDRLPLIGEDVQSPLSNSYSGDQPNPRLGQFFQSRAKEVASKDQCGPYSVDAFQRPIDTTKANAIYNMHTYWSKKPHDAIRQYIRHYVKPGGVVLDPFCGSGTTALAAIMEGAAAVAIDRSPAATFIAYNYCTQLDPSNMRIAFEELLRLVEPELRSLYETKCERCDGPAQTAFTVYSQVFQCSRCLRKLALYDCRELRIVVKGKEKAVNVCPYCYDNGHTEIIKSQGEKFGSIPVASTYVCEGGCKPKKGFRSYNDVDLRKREYFQRYDLGKLAEIDAMPIPYWYPQGFDMTGFSRYQRDALYYYDVREVADLFTKRNLWGLAIVKSKIDIVRSVCDLRILLTWISLKCSRMMRYCSDGIGRILAGTYYIPQVGRDSNVLSYLKEAFGDVLAHHQLKLQTFPSKPSLIISTQDSRTISDSPDNSVDYVFTDPPYADKEQYGELNYVWEAWLGFDTNWLEQEIIVNEVRGKGEGDWASDMRAVMNHCHRVLKEGRWLSLCYHDTSEGTWALIQDIMAEAGFVPDSAEKAIFISTSQKTHNQIHADKVTKRDLVINFRKPRLDEAVAVTEITGDEDPESFGEKVRLLISDYLLANPASSKDRIYDHIISRMVRAGTMQAHNFEEYLAQIAEPVREAVKKNLFEDKDPDLFGTHEVVLWYLKSTQLDVVDSAESAKEDEAAEKLRGFIQMKLKVGAWLDGIHYSDLFEHFIYAVQKKPRRPMAEWLLDYFYKTESGTYRLAATDEEARIKADGRSKGTSRRIKRYLALLEQGVAIPTGEQQNDSTLADWIRHAKLSAMYEAGKMLFERGGLSLERLSEEAAVNVEEDYQVCVRMLSRQEKK